MHEKINKRLILCTLVITSVLSGCQVVSVKEQALNVTLSNERDSILTRDKLSEASLNVLSMTGREAQICIDQPEECVKDLKKIPQILDEQLLSTASELYLANSLQNAKSAECNTSVLSKTQSQESNSCKNRISRNVWISSSACWIKAFVIVMPTCLKPSVPRKTVFSTTVRFRFVIFITWRLLI